MKAHPHDVRILEHQVVELTRVLSNVEEAHLDKADYQNHIKQIYKVHKALIQYFTNVR